MAIDTCIFDLNETLVYQVAKKEECDPDLRIEFLSHSGRYIAVRPFAEDAIQLAKSMFDKVALWSWAPNLDEILEVLRWREQFDRVIGLGILRELGEMPEVCDNLHLLKRLEWIVDDPNNVVMVQNMGDNVEPPERLLSVEPFLGLGNDVGLIDGFEVLPDKFGLQLDSKSRYELSRKKAEIREKSVPKYTVAVDGLTSRVVHGREVAFTKEGIELVKEVGDDVLDCVCYDGDSPSQIPERFKAKLLSDSRKAVTYLVDVKGRELVFKFYKRKTLERDAQVTIEIGLDQLEAAQFIRNNTQYSTPTPYFASMDVFCMDYDPTIESARKFMEEHLELKDTFQTELTIAENILLNSKQRVYPSVRNFYLDIDHYRTTGRVRLRIYDQRCVGRGSESNCGSEYLDRLKYLHRKHGLLFSGVL